MSSVNDLWILRAYYQFRYSHDSRRRWLRNKLLGRWKNNCGFSYFRFDVVSHIRKDIFSGNEIYYCKQLDWHY